jgi:hypothetical protein
VFNVQLSFSEAPSAQHFFNKTLREAPPSAKRKRDSAQPQTMTYDN